MEKYFTNLPNLLYPSLDPEKNSLFDYDEVKNLFRRFYIREDLLQDVTFFLKYEISDGERPDNVAEKVYGDPLLDWIILITNNIIDIYEEWPLDDKTFYEVLNRKYPNQSYLDTIYHETTEVKDANGRLILPKGLRVSSDFTIKNPLDASSTLNPVKSVSYLDIERIKNDNKRNILILKEKYFKIISSDIKKIKYSKSDQYINKKLKKTSRIF